MLNCSLEILIDKTSLIKDIVRSAVQDSIVKVCYDIEAQAKDKCPVDTGNLQNSIQTNLDNIDNLVGEVGTNVEYSVYVEYGKSTVPAQPYMIPAVESVRSEIGAVVAAIIDSELK